MTPDTADGVTPGSVVPPVGASAEPPPAALVAAPLGATIRQVALPAVIANLLMTAFHTIDTFWIGRSLGAEALAGIAQRVVEQLDARHG